jgi:hypothetical protein
LYKDENTGAIQVEFDPTNPQILYADLYEVRHGPWENGQWQGPDSGLYKSTDGGATWRQLTKGLPTFEQGLGTHRLWHLAQPSADHLRDGGREPANRWVSIAATTRASLGAS